MEQSAQRPIKPVGLAICHKNSFERRIYSMLPPLPSFRKWRLLPVLTLTLFCVSCSSGESLNPVHGKVLYQNQPIEGVVLTFHPKGATDIETIFPVGLTKEDGTFTLTTGKKEGAPAGEYTVTAICPVPTGVKAKGMSMGRSDSEDRFKGAYAREETSTIKVEIKNAKNELETINLR